MSETFVVFLGYIVYSMHFYKVIDLLVKFNFESIVTPRSVTDKTDFVVISPIFSVYKPTFPRIMNGKFQNLLSLN